jgi:hypothetical protein
MSSAPDWASQQKPSKRNWDNRAVSAKIPVYSSIVDEHCSFTKTPRFMRFNREQALAVVEAPPAFSSRGLKERDVTAYLEQSSSYGFRNSPRFLTEASRQRQKTRQRRLRAARSDDLRREDEWRREQAEMAGAAVGDARAPPTAPGDIITINVFENDQGESHDSFSRLLRNGDDKLTVVELLIGVSSNLYDAVAVCVACCTCART